MGGLADNLFNGGRWLNATLFAVDAKIAVLTALALVLLGGAWVLGERAWPVPRALASGAALLGLAALAGFLLGVPLFYGPSRSVEMSWQAALCAVLLGISFGATHMHRTSRLLSDDGLRRALRPPHAARRARHPGAQRRAVHGRGARGLVRLRVSRPG